MLVLAMILAFVKVPVTHNAGLLLLLDDVVDHLDARHRQVLLEDVLVLPQSRKSQVWMTGSDSSAFSPLRHQAHFLKEVDLSHAI